MKAIIENDSLLTIQTINEKSIPLRHICNLIEDINMLTQDIKNFELVYCKKSANNFADRIAEETIRCCTQKIANNE